MKSLPSIEVPTAMLTRVCLLPFLVIASWIPSLLAEPISFADRNLEAAVREAIFEKRGTEAPLTSADVASVSHIVATGKQIQSLQGIEHCHSLMLLDIADNAIEDLSQLAGLRRLQSLTLAGNRIADLTPLAGLTAMQLLDLSDNPLTDLSPLAKLKKLRTLYLANTDIQSIESIGELDKVWSLDLSATKVTDLTPLKGLRWLRTVDISSTPVQSLAPLDPLTEIQRLIMPNTKVSDLGPLIESCRRDWNGQRRFAPFLRIYLAPGEVHDQSLEQQIRQLEQFGTKVIE